MGSEMCIRDRIAGWEPTWGFVGGGGPDGASFVWLVTVGEAAITGSGGTPGRSCQDRRRCHRSTPRMTTPPRRHCVKVGEGGAALFLRVRTLAAVCTLLATVLALTTTLAHGSLLSSVRFWAIKVQVLHFIARTCLQGNCPCFTGMYARATRCVMRSGGVRVTRTGGRGCGPAPCCDA